MIKATLAIAVCALCSFAGTAPAHALNARTWVSGTGVDQAGCGPIASPCRSLQYAHNNTSAGGEIDVKDSAGYGSIIINKAINIIGDGSLAGVLAGAGANAITINAGASDAIVLRGLTIEGARVGANGIVFNSGGALTVANCLVQGFAKTTGTSGYGIWIKHTSGLPSITITGTTASYNDAIGIVYSPSGTGGGQYTVSRSTASHNGYGISVYAADTSALLKVTVTHSEALHNTGFGVQFWGSIFGTYARLSHTVAFGNNPGLYLGGTLSLALSHVIAGQSVGADIVGNGDQVFLTVDGTNLGSKSSIAHELTTTPY